MGKRTKARDLRSHCADRPREPHGGRRGVSARYKALVEGHSWKGKVAADIGCGSGAGTLLLATLGARAVGIDVDPEVIALATSRAKEDGLANAHFLCADVEARDWRKLARAPDGLDGVIAHLCFSEAIAKRAARALKPGGVFIVRSFEKQMWKEAGGTSPFAFSRGEMPAMLRKLGFTVMHLEVERRTQSFASFEAFEGDFLGDPGRRARWEEDGRVETLKHSFESGNRTLTESFLVFEARKEGPAPKARKGPRKPPRQRRRAPC